MSEETPLQFPAVYLKQGQSGPAVKAMKELLRSLGRYDGPIDDSFTADLGPAITQFQRDLSSKNTNYLHVQATGTIIPEMWEAWRNIPEAQRAQFAKPRPDAPAIVADNTGGTDNAAVVNTAHDIGAVHSRIVRDTALPTASVNPPAAPVVAAVVRPALPAGAELSHNDADLAQPSPAPTPLADVTSRYAAALRQLGAQAVRPVTPAVPPAPGAPVNLLPEIVPPVAAVNNDVPPVPASGVQFAPAQEIVQAIDEPTPPPPQQRERRSIVTRTLDAVGAPNIPLVHRTPAGRAADLQRDYLRENGPSRQIISPFLSNVAIGSPEGMRWHPILHRNMPHATMDIPAPLGTPLLAVDDGWIVADRSDNDARGVNVVLFTRGGLRIPYLHGQPGSIPSWIPNGEAVPVSRGNIVMRVGESGRATGPHAHIEIQVRDGLENRYRPVSEAQFFGVRNARGAVIRADYRSPVPHDAEEALAALTPPLRVTVSGLPASAEVTFTPVSLLSGEPPRDQNGGVIPPSTPADTIPIPVQSRTIT